MSRIRITDGANNRDMQLLDNKLSEHALHLSVGGKYLELTTNMDDTNGLPIVYVKNSGVDYYPKESFDFRVLYDISFNSNWVPSLAFSSVFELVDTHGETVETATVATTRYRFKKDTDNYTGISTLSNLFKDCTQLRSIELPQDWGTVVNVSNMFNGCTNLMMVSLPSSWGNVSKATSMFNNCSSLDMIVLPTAWEKMTDAVSMFQGCTSLTSMVLPDDWGTMVSTSIMFKDCTQLVNVTLPLTWESLDSKIDMFLNTGFTFRDEGILISEGYYSSPENEIFPTEAWITGIGLDDVHLVNNNPFYTIGFRPEHSWTPTEKFNEMFELVADDGSISATGHSGISRYRFKRNMENYTGVTSTSAMFLNCLDLVSIELPPVWENVTDAGLMFSGCESLEHITLPDSWGSVTKVNEMFYRCYSLAEITPPSSWGSITDAGHLFSTCTSLTDVTLPSSWGVMTRVRSMFAACTSIDTIILPDDWGNVTDTSAMFDGSTNLTMITLPTDMSGITTKSDMFKDTGFASKAPGIEVSEDYYRSPKLTFFPLEVWVEGIGLDDVIDQSPNPNPLMDISFTGDHEFGEKFNMIFELVDDDGYIAPKATADITKYRFKRDISGYVGTSTANGIFTGVKVLKSVTLPEWGVIFDASSVFSGCTSLTSVVFPSSWENIVNLSLMFKDCTNLEEVTLPSSWGKVSNLSNMFNLCSKISNVELPDDWGSVTSTSSMFYGCEGITDIALPSEWKEVYNTTSMFHNAINLKLISVPTDMSGISNYTNMFTNTGFVFNSSGIKLSEGYYRSSEETHFPANSWMLGIGLDDLTLINNNPFYDIEFSGRYSPSGLDKGKLTLSCELVNDAGVIVYYGDTDVHRYRFKVGREDWSYTPNLSAMFHWNDTLTKVEFPPSWGEATSVAGIFSLAEALREVILPEDWGKITVANAMFYRCHALSSIILPSSWGELTTIENMFRECTGITDITLPVIPDGITTTNALLDSGFTSTGPGILVSEGYYKSPSPGVFPIECWKSDMML